MKKKLKMIINIIMTILFIILMGYYITGNMIHEILGTIIFVLFFLHNILNIKWYKSLLKGKHNALRIFHISINILLLIAMLGIFISGMMMSTYVFEFLNINMSRLGRKIHMVCNSWGFILMAMHVGLHLNSMISKMSLKIKKKQTKYICICLLVMLLAFGIYAIFSVQLLKDMFLVNEYKFFDYEQSNIIFYLKFFSILITISFLTYYSIKLLRKKKMKAKKDAKSISM